MPAWGGGCRLLRPSGHAGGAEPAVGRAEEAPGAGAGAVGRGVGATGPVSWPLLFNTKCKTR